MTEDAPKTLCPCGQLTELPFMCRACWAALGHERQRQFYRAVQRQKRTPGGLL